ncbi:MAG: aminoacyl-tRNA hydrolase [Planctomycetota bacterium]
MKMVVGLGNPGQKYIGTRHNVGYDVIAELAGRYDVGRPKAKFNGEIVETIIKNEKTVLICPLTFMNLSGQCVRAAVDFYKLEIDELLIICDDFNLAVGRLRLRPSGSAGGQNGLKDIINRLGSQTFGRLRLGIGMPPPQWDVANYVLGKFSEEDRPEVAKSVARAADAVELWIAEGIQTAMNRFNADPNRKPKQKTNNEPIADKDKAESVPDDNEDN